LTERLRGGNERWRGSWAVVTGASAGIGRAIAEQLAAEGSNLFLTARRLDRLNEIADWLRMQRGIEVETVAADLAEPGAPEEIYKRTEASGVRPSLLVNNAGFGLFGEFRAADRARTLAMIQVNCAAVVALTHLYLPGMIERRSGDILIVSSTAAFQSVPYHSVYAATKGFDLLFAEGLAEEVSKSGVRVCALCPGNTETEFHELAREPSDVPLQRQKADEVARLGLEGLRNGKHTVVCGLGNLVGMEIQRLLPRRLVSSVSERIFRPKR
jgi:short-subunit dehydrogenase